MPGTAHTPSRPPRACAPEERAPARTRDTLHRARAPEGRAPGLAVPARAPVGRAPGFAVPARAPVGRALGFAVPARASVGRAPAFAVPARTPVGRTTAPRASQLTVCNISVGDEIAELRSSGNMILSDKVRNDNAEGRFELRATILLDNNRRQLSHLCLYQTGVTRECARQQVANGRSFNAKAQSGKDAKGVEVGNAAPYTT